MGRFPGPSSVGERRGKKKAKHARVGWKLQLLGGTDWGRGHSYAAPTFGQSPTSRVATDDESSPRLKLAFELSEGCAVEGPCRTRFGVSSSEAGLEKGSSHPRVPWDCRGIAAGDPVAERLDLRRVIRNIPSKVARATDQGKWRHAEVTSERRDI